MIHVLLLFSVLNPFVLPFGAIYFFIENGVMKNQVFGPLTLDSFLMLVFQLLHVYAKNYEGNGQLLLIRMVRYSLDGGFVLLC